MDKDVSKLDLAFVLDTTSSMQVYIDHAKKNIKKIADDLKTTENCDLRVGFVNYRDHCDHTYLTQINDFSADIELAKTFLDQTNAQGGGDDPEAVCCGLDECLNGLKWREDAVKVAVLIADSPPHGIGEFGDKLPNGCPLGKDPVDIAHRMAEKGITLFTIGCEPAQTPYRGFFMALSLVSGGQYVPLNDAAGLTDMIVGSAREDISMEKLIATRVHREYMKEVADKGGRVDEDELTKRIHGVLNSLDEVKIRAFQNKVKLVITDPIKELSKKRTLKEWFQFGKENNLWKIGIPNFNIPSFVEPVAVPAVKLMTPRSVIKRKPVLSKRRPVKRASRRKSSAKRTIITRSWARLMGIML